jgi:hypothetical protein
MERPARPQRLALHYFTGRIPKNATTFSIPRDFNQLLQARPLRAIADDVKYARPI